MSSQIEPPTFLVELNYNDLTSSETNENIQEIERSYEYQPNSMSPQQPYMNGYPAQYQQRYEDEMKYYQAAYPNINENMQYRQEMLYAQQIAKQQQQEYMPPMMQQQYMQYENPPMQSNSPKSKQLSQSIEGATTPDHFLSELNPEWREVQHSKKEKWLKDFMKKFIAFQVVEANKATPVEKAFWDWWFSLFPCNTSSSTRFKQYSDVWISFLCFKKPFWRQFAKWHATFNFHLLEYAKNDYAKEKLKVCNNFLISLIEHTRNKSFKRSETLYVSFLTSMAHFSTNRETMIDDISIEIESCDPNINTSSSEYKALELPEMFPNIEYLISHHKKLFLLDYYKLLDIESIDDHPELKEIEEVKEEEPVVIQMI